MAASASADDRPPIRLELDACLDPARDDIERAVRVEVGSDDAGDPRAVAVRIACATAGLDAGVVLEVRPPDSARRYRYALDWRAQPVDARPRLIGLAVAEAVDASRIELVAVAEPAAIVAPAPPRAVSAPPAWSLGVAIERRAFAGHGGAALIGVGLAPARRLTPHLRVALELAAEGATVLTESGAVVVRSLSAAPRLGYRVGARVHGELGIGARLGVVRITGEALPNSQLVGQHLVRPWLGPAASLAIGADLAPNLALTAGVELGVAVTGATARDLGQPIAVLDGAWAALGVTATLAL